MGDKMMFAGLALTVSLQTGLQQRQSVQGEAGSERERGTSSRLLRLVTQGLQECKKRQANQEKRREANASIRLQRLLRPTLMISGLKVVQEFELITSSVSVCLSVCLSLSLTR